MKKFIATLMLVMCAMISFNGYGFEQHGRATYYLFTGRKTASGEIMRPEKLTCAHRTLPFGTMLKVTNKKNGKSVIVKVNDRGPFGGKNKIIDLSKSAAEAIDMIHSGIVDVVIETVNGETAQIVEPESEIRTTSGNPALLSPDVTLTAKNNSSLQQLRKICLFN